MLCISHTKKKLTQNQKGIVVFITTKASPQNKEMYTMFLNIVHNVADYEWNLIVWMSSLLQLIQWNSKYFVSKIGVAVTQGRGGALPHIFLQPEIKAVFSAK